MDVSASSLRIRRCFKWGTFSEKWVSFCVKRFIEIYSNESGAALPLRASQRISCCFFTFTSAPWMGHNVFLVLFAQIFWRKSRAIALWTWPWDCGLVIWRLVGVGVVVLLAAYSTGYSCVAGCHWTNHWMSQLANPSDFIYVVWIYWGESPACQCEDAGHGGQDLIDCKKKKLKSLYSPFTRQRPWGDPQHICCCACSSICIVSISGQK